MSTRRVIKEGDAARRGVVAHEPPAFEADPHGDALPAAQAVAAEDEGPPPAARRRVLRGAEARAAAQPYDIAPPFEATADAEPPASDSSAESGSSSEKAHDGDPPNDPDAGDPEPDLEALKAEWDAEWQERLDDAVEDARADGHASGYAQAQDELQAEVDAQKEAHAADAARLKTLWTDHIEASKPLLVELALDAAEAILDAPLPSSVKGASARAITAAVDALAGDPPLTVRLHPVDHMRLQEAGVTDQLDAVHADLTWNPDSDLAEGDWSVSSPSGLVRRLREEIAQTLRHRLSETDT